VDAVERTSADEDTRRETFADTSNALDMTQEVPRDRAGPADHGGRVGSFRKRHQSGEAACARLDDVGAVGFEDVLLAGAADRAAEHGPRPGRRIRPAGWRAPARGQPGGASRRGEPPGGPPPPCGPRPGCER